MNESLPEPDPSTSVPPASASTAGPTRQTGLVRPMKGRRIGGVCAAIADRYGWNRTTVRVITAVSVLIPGPQVLAYVIAWIVIPSER